MPRIQAYLVAVLDVSGWQLPGVIQYRFRDAHEFALDRLRDGVTTRAVKVLPVVIDQAAVFQQERADPVVDGEAPK